MVGLGKVVANYPLPTIDNLLAHFKDCKYFSTLDLQSRYYHIKLTLEAGEKTPFIINKGKWKFHSLPFGINLGPSAFSYVLGKVLASCHNFALNYLHDIFIFSRTLEEHLDTPRRSVHTAEACRPENQMQQMQVLHI